MMNNPDINIKVSFTENGKVIKEKTDPLIVKYHELCKKYYLPLIINSDKVEKSVFSDVLRKAQIKQDLKYKEITKNIKNEFNEIGYSDNEVCDILVKYLYHIKNSNRKSILWLCYGDIIYENLKKHLKLKTKAIQCIDCGKWFEVSVKDNNTCRCKECLIEYKREQNRLRVKKHRKSKM